MRAVCSARCRWGQVAAKQRSCSLSWGLSRMAPVGIVGDPRQQVRLVADSGTHNAGAAPAGSILPEDSAVAPLGTEQKLQLISDSIRGIPDFPKPGILFWDVTTLMLNPQAFQLCIDLLVDRYQDQKVDVVAGVCSCGGYRHPHSIPGART